MNEIKNSLNYVNEDQPSSKNLNDEQRSKMENMENFDDHEYENENGHVNSNQKEIEKNEKVIIPIKEFIKEANNIPKESIVIANPIPPTKREALQNSNFSIEEKINNLYNVKRSSSNGKVMEFKKEFISLFELDKQDKLEKEKAKLKVENTKIDKKVTPIENKNLNCNDYLDNKIFNYKKDSKDKQLTLIETNTNTNKNVKDQIQSFVFQMEKESFIPQQKNRSFYDNISKDKEVGGHVTEKTKISKNVTFDINTPTNKKAEILIHDSLLPSSYHSNSNPNSKYKNNFLTIGCPKEINLYSSSNKGHESSDSNYFSNNSSSKKESNSENKIVDIKSLTYKLKYMTSKEIKKLDLK